MRIIIVVLILVLSGCFGHKVLSKEVNAEFSVSDFYAAGIALYVENYDVLEESHFDSESGFLNNGFYDIRNSNHVRQTNEYVKASSDIRGEIISQFLKKNRGFRIRKLSKFDVEGIEDLEDTSFTNFNIDYNEMYHSKYIMIVSNVHAFSSAKKVLIPIGGSLTHAAQGSLNIPYNQWEVKMTVDVVNMITSEIVNHATVLGKSLDRESAISNAIIELVDLF